MVDDTLVEMGLMSSEEVKSTKAMTMNIGNIMYEEFSKRNLHLIDGKIEFEKN